MNLHRSSLAVFALAGTLSLAVACSSPTGPKPPAGQGQLAISLVDAPNPAVDEIHVNISRVTAHSTSAGWVTVSTFDPPLGVDLLKLTSAAASLGFANLPPGTVTQVRLLVAVDGNYVLTGGNQVPLKVPSGYESGIKVKGPFEIAACARASVTLDFDGKKSIEYHPTGTGDEWILRPVIRVRAHGSDDVGCSGAPDAGSDGSETPQEGGGSACSAAAECLSGVCSANSCAPGAPWAPCFVDADCASNSCVGQGEDPGTCAPGAAGGAGAPCTTNVECLSNVCSSNLCGTGAQGTPCNANTDCQEGLACSSNSCSAPAL
jgi:Domain of unknown function (DUF4382)